VVSCKRTNGRSIDHIFSNGKKVNKTRTEDMKTSDHLMLWNEIRIEMKEQRNFNKEMIFSSVINDPKMKDVEHYLKFIINN